MAWGSVFICCVGGLNGLYQIIGEILQPFRNKLVVLLHLNRESIGHKLIHIIYTFILVDFSWIFFRANSFTETFEIIKAMFTIKNPWILFDGSIYMCGLGDKNFRLMIIAIIILIFADFCKVKGVKIRKVIVKQDYWFRWLFIAFAIGIILLFGMWGPSFNEANFIYFQF